MFTRTQVKARGLTVAILLILFIDAFATALFIGARITVEDGMRSSLAGAAAMAGQTYRAMGSGRLHEALAAGSISEIFLLEAGDTIIYSTDPAAETGRPRIILNTDRAEIAAARAGAATAGYPFSTDAGYLMRAYVGVDTAGTVLGLTAAAPSFTALDHLRKVYWSWIVLSIALAVVIAALYHRAVEQVATERERADRGERFEALSRMAATVAHEIRNPLNIISATLELRDRKIRERGDDEERAMLADLKEEVDRLELVVQDFLDLSRERELSLAQVDAGEIVELVVDREERRLGAGEKPAPEIRIIIGKEAGAFCADRDRVIQALTNILRNATDAAGSSGSVEVRASGRHDSVVFTVEDSGAGVPEAERGRIFEPFLTTKSRGSGLGLSVVKAAVDAHEGELAVDGGTLGGALFTLRFPRRGPARA